MSQTERTQRSTTGKPATTTQHSTTGRAATTATRTVVGSCPLDCPDTCSWHITVDSDGNAIKLRGNPDHPVTAGGLCPKVNPWLENAADPSRLTQPMRRVGPKGQGRFEPISWEEAFEQMAARYHQIIDTFGGAAIWPYVGTGNLGWLQGANGPAKVWGRMGASAHNLSICSVAGRDGISLSVGTGGWLDVEDFAKAGLVLLWGTNTLVTNRHLWPFVEKARANGAPLVVVDPVRTRTAEQADLHIALRPGTDGALALGLCRAIVDRGGHDERFLQQRTFGWDAFEAELSDWSLDHTAAITGVAAATIETLAEMAISAPPLAARIGHGIQRQTFGGQAMRLVSCLPAVTGAYDQPGGGSLYSSTGSGKPYNTPGLDAAGQSTPSRYARRPRTLTMTNLGYNLTELDDPPVEALFIWGANPVVSNPDVNLVKRGLSRDDLFTVVVDIYPTETTTYADLVLPSAMQHEQIEINDGYSHRYLNWNEPAVAPAGSCLAHTEIFRRLAAAMGYDDPALFATDEELAADFLDSAPFIEQGLTLDRLRSDGFIRMPDLPPPAQRSFPTPTGRFQFASKEADADGHGFVANYRAAAEASQPDLLEDGDGLALIAAASEHHVNSTFAGTARTLSVAATPSLNMHPDDAVARGLVDGASVRVTNARGVFEAILSISDRTRTGVVSTTKGWWHHGLNNTVPERDADMGGGAIFHDNVVWVRANGPDS